jgi:hypothetical protein
MIPSPLRCRHPLLRVPLLLLFPLLFLCSRSPLMQPLLSSSHTAPATTRAAATSALPTRLAAKTEAEVLVSSWLFSKWGNFAKQNWFECANNFTYR